MNTRIVNGFNTLWWQRLPLAACRISKPLAVSLADGVYLTAWPEVAALAPLISIGVGALAGWLHPGLTFTSSLIVVWMFVLAGAFGAALGAYGWLGYVLADLGINHPWQEGGVRVLLSYLLLAMAAVAIPLISQALRADILKRVQRKCRGRSPSEGSNPQNASVDIEAASAQGPDAARRSSVAQDPHLIALLQAILHAGLIYLWARSVPTIVWAGDQPPQDAITPLLGAWLPVVLIAAAGAGVRMMAESIAMAQVAVRSRLITLIVQMTAIQPRAIPQLQGVGATGFRVLTISLMLSGMLGQWGDWVGLIVLVALIELGRKTVVSGLTPWVKLVSSLPLSLRLLIGAIASSLLGQFVVGQWWPRVEHAADYAVAFRPILIATLLSMAVMALLFPISHTEEGARQ